MLFQTPEFAIFFLVTVALFYVVNFRRGKIVLLVASYYFYARWNAWYVVMLLGLTAVDFYAARAMDAAAPRRRMVLLWLAVTANLGFLATLKYTNFVADTVRALLHMPSDVPLLAVLVPIGLSFHTFQSISYIVDVYRRKIRAADSALDYALYLAFFPQLLSGPIVRAELFFAELARWTRPTAGDVIDGIGSILVGLVKKTVVADQFGSVADTYFGAVGAHPGAPAAWSAAFAFAMQIYFDFSGYTDIVRGLVRLLGFEFPINFRRPYLAVSFTEFWRRWHITLSTWLRDYLYIPLGGSRHGAMLTVRNLMITMVLGGLWHGANWTFVVWGVYHGALLSIERLTGERAMAARVVPGSPQWTLRVIITFTLVTVGWVFFRAQNFGDAFATLRAMVAGGWGAGMLVPWHLVLIAIAFGYELRAEFGRVLSWRELRPVVQIPALAALLIAFELFAYAGASKSFIYFKF